MLSRWSRHRVPACRPGSRPKPTWETVLGADVAGPGSREPIKLGEVVEQAWQLAAPDLRRELRSDAGPVLLHDGAVLARYQAMAARSVPDQSAPPAGTTQATACPVIAAIMSKSPS
jgi:hypothetical protein